MPGVAPGVHHEVHEDDKAEHQQHDHAWFVLPELLEAFGDFVEIH